jgi:hypothetical protein
VLLARVRNSFAAAFLAAALSLGMAAQPAQALTIPPIAPPVLTGGTAAAGSAVVTCVASVVCATAVTAAAITVGLYATRNSWVPVLDRWIGKNETTDTTVGGTPGQSFFLGSSSLSADGRSFTIIGYDTRTSGSGVIRAFGTYYTCMTGTAVSTWTYKGFASSVSGGASLTAVTSCPVGTTMGALYTGPHTTYGYSPTNVIRWGSGAYPTESAVYRATAECVKDDGTTQNLVVEYSGNDPNGFMIPSCSAAGYGDHAKGVDIAIKLPGRTDYQPAWSVDADPQPLYPDCDPSQTVGCILRVEVDGTVCTVGDEDCVNWMALPTSRLRCLWGPYAVSLVQCDMLERAYQTGGAQISDATTDGNPATGTDANPTPTGTAAAPFPTSVPVPTSTPSPIPTPTTPTPENPDPVPVDSGQGCYPTGTAAWNPVEWVLRPVQCALVWAFVPPAGLDTRLAEFDAAWDSSDAGTWVSTITDPAGDVVDAFASGGGACGGPEWTLSLSAMGGGSYPFRPFDSCREPLASVAPVVKGVGMALVFVIGFRAAANPVLGALGLPRIPGRRQLWQTEIHGTDT